MTSELKKNLIKVILCLFAFSALAVVVMVFFPFFNYTVITGVLLGFTGTALSFLFLALVVSRSIEKSKENATKFVQATYSLRLLFMALVIVIGLKLPYFNGYTTVIPFLLLRPTIMLVNFVFKSSNSKDDNIADNSDSRTNV